MNHCDFETKRIISKLLEEGCTDINPRPKYADGTPAHTLSYNHEMVTYDLSKGEFPLCTLRPTAIKSGIAEILWIYREEMLMRQSIDCYPFVEINPEKTNMYDLTLNDFKIVGYPLEEIKKVNPQLKFDIGI